IKNMYFDTRYYENITMPGGFYDALRIEIGKAEGKNWWCVMYPSLCLYSASESDTLQESMDKEEYGILTSTDEYQFRLKIVELFADFCNRLKGN
ncbi:MAG: stage II sporulation protein R, partial [Ruminococcus sp.]